MYKYNGVPKTLGFSQYTFLHASLECIQTVFKLCVTYFWPYPICLQLEFYLKVIEHVANPAEFCKSLAALTVPDGATIISTINRSMRSYATAIVAAEYLLHWV